jgi:DNA polymerase
LRWSERQLAMLAEFGVRCWASPAAPGVAPAAEALAGVAPASRAPAAPGAVARQTHGAPASEVVAPPAAARRTPLPRVTPAPRGAGIGADATTVPVAASRADDPVSGERARRIASLDWTALRAEVEACTACGLCRTRRQTVFGVGHPEARWMVVGEAPGEQEDRQGEPFVGAAGQLLDAMLRALRLTRATDGDAPPAQRVYIANTLKCRPPGNRNPAPDELLRCEPFLQRQIDLVRPDIILAMGRFAVQALLRSSEPVGRLRGRVHAYQGVPLVVTYHPAYLLRNLPDKAKAWDDLCLAAEVAEAAATGRAPGAG